VPQQDHTTIPDTILTHCAILSYLHIRDPRQVPCLMPGVTGKQVFHNAQLVPSNSA